MREIVFKSLRGIGLGAGAVLLMIGFTGCSGSFGLPPVTLTLTVIDDASFGPEAGVPGGAPLDNTPLFDSLGCNMPSEADLRALIREEVGEVAAGFIKLRSVVVDQVLLEPWEGGFDSLTEIKLNVVTLGIDGIMPLYLGAARDPEGLRGTVAIVPESRVDLLPVVRQRDPACGTLIMRVSGTTPEETVRFRARLQVTARFSIEL